MKRVIEADKDGFLELLQERREEAEANTKRRELPQTTRSRHQGITQGLDFAMAAVRDWQLPEPPKTWLYGLTADEWFRLASTGQDSEIAPCCGNIGELRDLLRELMIFQSEDDTGWLLPLGEQILLVVYEGDGNKDGDADAGHGLGVREKFPLLNRVLDGIKAQQAERAASPSGTTITS